jgi:hypothetical protein
MIESRDSDDLLGKGADPEHRGGATGEITATPETMR